MWRFARNVKIILADRSDFLKVFLPARAITLTNGQHKHTHTRTVAFKINFNHKPDTNQCTSCRQSQHNILKYQFARIEIAANPLIQRLPRPKKIFQRKWRCDDRILRRRFKVAHRHLCKIRRVRVRLLFVTCKRFWVWNKHRSPWIFNMVHSFAKSRF